MKPINNKLLINKFILKDENQLKRKESCQYIDEYPFSIPVIRNFKKLVFKKQVTFIIGENGSGKSTLIEAFTRCCGFNTEGGSRNFRFSTHDPDKYQTDSSFYEYLNIDKSWELPIFDGYFLRSKALYNLAAKIYDDEKLGKSCEIESDYGKIPLFEQSHGKSVLSLLTNRISKRGLYIFDEPETGLSPKTLSTINR